jgi:hypothetical protein
MAMDEIDGALKKETLEPSHVGQERNGREVLFEAQLKPWWGF